MIYKFSQTLKRFFSLPVFSDEEEHYLARLLVKLARLFLILTPIILLPFALTVKNFIAVFIIIVAIVLMCTLGIWLAHSRRIKLASETMIWGILLMNTVGGLVLGLDNFPPAAYILVIALAATLLGSQGVLKFGVLSIIALLIVILVNINLVNYESKALEQIINLTVINIGLFILITSLLRIGIRHLEGVVKRIDRADTKISGQDEQRQIMFDLSENILATFSLEKLIEHTLNAVRETIQSDGTCFYWVDEKDQVLRVGNPQGYLHVPDIFKFNIPLGQGIVGHIALTGKAEYVNNAFQDKRSVYPEGFLPNAEERDHLIVVPIQSRNRIIAVIVAGRNGKNAHPFIESDFLQVELLVRHAGLAVQNIQLFSEVQSDQARFRALTKNLPGAVYQCKNDAVYSLLYVSNEVEQITGYQKEIFLDGQLNFSDLFHPDDRGLLIPLVKDEEFSENRQPYTYTYRLRHKSGNWRWVEDRGTSIFDADGNFLYLQGFLWDVTARKEAEADVHNLNVNLEALVEKRSNELGYVNRQIQALMDNAPMPIFIKDASEFKYALFNKQYQNLRGLSYEQIKNHTEYDFYPEALADEIRHIDKAIVENKTSQTVEISIPDSNGKIHTLLSTKFPIFDDMQNVQAIGGISLDITLRKEIEEKLTLSEEKYRDLYENNPLMLFTLGTDGTTLGVNQAAVTGLEYDAAEMVGESVLKVFHPAEYEKVLKIFNAFVEHPVQNSPWEFQKLTKSGRTIWASETARLIHDSRGQALVLIACEDITLRKEIEERLTLSEEKYRTFYENVSDVLYETDFHGTITSISASVEKWGGYKQNEIVGHHITEFYTDPADYPALDSAMETQGEVNDFEIRLKRKSGEAAIFSITAHVIFNQAGLPISTAGVMRDITTRKQAEAEIASQNNQLEAVYQITLNLLNRNQIDEILNDLLNKILPLLDVDQANIDLLVDSDVVETRAVTDGQPLKKGDRVRRGESDYLTWQAIDTGQPVILEDYNAWHLRRKDYDNFPYHAVAQIPMLHENRAIGVLSLNIRELWARVEAFVPSPASSS